MLRDLIPFNTARQPLHAERAYGAFRRDIPLGVEVDEDAVKAEFKNDMLTIVLPKTKEAQAEAKRITVKGE